MPTKDKAAGLGAAKASITHYTRHCTTQAAQRELFGLVAGADDRTTTCGPCPRCATAIATIGPRSGPHHAALRCLRRHFLRWLPKPGGVA
jgi:hypothetical protein